MSPLLALYEFIVVFFSVMAQLFKGEDKKGE